MMTPLTSIFKSGTSKPPKIDQHGLFTSIQVSVPVLESDLQVYEPWRRKKNRPKECRVTLYANDTSPFLVWHKLDKGRSLQKSPGGSNGVAVTLSSSRPRCVISVSRAKLAKTTGGSFELTDFASSLTFRFIAKTIREAETWVERLAEESLREAHLDIKSICSSRSSFSSSTSSFSSPDTSPHDSNKRFFPSMPAETRSKSNHRKSASFSDASGAFIQLLNNGSSVIPLSPLAIEDITEVKVGDSDLEADVFAVKSTAAHIAACKLGHTRSSSKTFPRIQISTRHKQQHSQHIRAQPHLGLNIVLDKHRPDLRMVVPDIEKHEEAKATSHRSELPFSEYFVNVPSF